MGLFDQEKKHVPIWFMRQAGRYHKHYQGIRSQHDFMTMCKNADLATEITMGPIEDFDFDAAILFSDLLFPLEQLDMGLTYQNGPPELAWHLDSKEKIGQLKVVEKSDTFYDFQYQALTQLKQKLPETKSLLGFVGAPFTLYTYAVEGSHKGNLISTKTGLFDGRFEAFFEILKPILIENMKVQARANPDAICLFDTAAGELDHVTFHQYALASMVEVAEEFKKEFPETKVLYYSKCTQLCELSQFTSGFVNILGVDWRIPLAKAFDQIDERFMIQGNLDPCWLFLPWDELKNRIDHLIAPLKDNPEWKKRWIFGLGHGVLPKTPESNVRDTVKYIKEQLTI